MFNTVLFLAFIDGASPAPLTAPEIVERMLRADDERRSALGDYTCLRRYQFENKRFNKRATMTVRMSCDRAGVKRFQIVDESGSGTARNRILRKMLEAEQEASQRGEREQTRITPRHRKEGPATCWR